MVRPLPCAVLKNVSAPEDVPTSRYEPVSIEPPMITGWPISPVDPGVRPRPPPPPPPPFPPGPPPPPPRPAQPPPPLAARRPPAPPMLPATRSPRRRRPPRAAIDAPVLSELETRPDVRDRGVT